MVKPYKVVYLACLCRKCSKYPNSPYYKKESLGSMIAEEERKMTKEVKNEEERQNIREIFVTTKIAELKEFLTKETGEELDFLPLFFNEMTNVPNDVKKSLCTLLKILPKNDIEKLNERVGNEIFLDGMMEGVKKIFGIKTIDIKI